jgi:hypothetical protein
MINAKTNGQTTKPKAKESFNLQAYKTTERQT